jgi:hypothetical protein
LYNAVRLCYFQPEAVGKPITVDTLPKESQAGKEKPHIPPERGSICPVR